MSIKEKYSKFTSGKYDYTKDTKQSIDTIPSITNQESIPDHEEIELLEKSEFIKGIRIYGLVKETEEGLFVEWDEKMNDFYYEKENIKTKDLPFNINNGDVLSVIVTSVDTKKASENAEFILSYTNHTQKEIAKLNRKDFPKNKAILFASLIFRPSSHHKAYYGSNIIALPVILLGIAAVIMLTGPFLFEGDGNYFINAYENLTTIILDGAETTEQKIIGTSHLALFIAFPFVCLWGFLKAYKEIKGIKELVKILDKTKI